MNFIGEIACINIICPQESVYGGKKYKYCGFLRNYFSFVLSSRSSYTLQTVRHKAKFSAALFSERFFFHPIVS